MDGAMQKLTRDIDTPLCIYKQQVCANWVGINTQVKYLYSRNNLLFMQKIIVRVHTFIDIYNR